MFAALIAESVLRYGNGGDKSGANTFSTSWRWQSRYLPVGGMEMITSWQEPSRTGANGGNRAEPAVVEREEAAAN